MKKHKCSYWKCSMHVGLFLAVFFVICFAWFYIQPEEKELHMALLNLSFLGWSGMNFPSFLLGAIQSFIWGYILMGVWYLVGCCHKGGSCVRCEEPKK